MLQIFVPAAIKWPSRQTVKSHLPAGFRKHFPKTRVIIDCTELYIQRPRTPTNQYRTFSGYKGRNTLKSLLGVTPTGAVSYVSDLWSGNVSDRYIFNNCGFMDYLRAGDSVMADRGFTVADLLLPRGVKLNIPAFTRPCKYGKGRRLNASEVKSTRMLAKLRIHVERAIERIKRFRSLSGIMRVSTKPLASQMFRVAAALTNLYKPLIK